MIAERFSEAVCCRGFGFQFSVSLFFDEFRFLSSFDFGDFRIRLVRELTGGSAASNDAGHA